MPLQFAKQEQVQARGPPTFSIDTGDAFDLSIFTAFDFDPPTLGEQVENALFSA